MTTVLATWEALDGSLHRTEKGARTADAAIRVKRWIDGRGIARGGEWSADMILRTMLEDAGTLGGLLTDFAVCAHMAKR